MASDRGADHQPSGPASSETSSEVGATPRPPTGCNFTGTPRVGLILLGALLVLRLALVTVTARNPLGGILVDSQYYISLATSLTENGVYHTANGQDLIWPPGYPLFLALTSGWSAPDPVAVSLAQLLLTVVIAAMVVWLGGKVAGGEGRLGGAWLYALLPTGALWALTVMSETLFTALLILACIVWAFTVEGRSPWMAAGVGLLLGLAAYVRPIGLALIPLWAVMAALAVRKKVGGLGPARLGLAIVAGSALAVLPWSLRNLVVNGQPTFSGVGGRTFYNFNVAQVKAEVEGTSRDVAAGELGSDGGDFTESLRLIVEHPLPFAIEQGKGVFRTLLGLEAGSWARLMALPGGIQEGLGIVSSVLNGDPRQALSRLKAVALNPSTGPILVLAGVAETMTILLYILAAAYMIGGRKDGLGLTGLLFWSAVVLALVPAAAGQARFRIPAEPMLCILAGPGVSVVARALSRRRHNVSQKATSQGQGEPAPIPWLSRFSACRSAGRPSTTVRTLSDVPPSPTARGGRQSQGWTWTAETAATARGET